MNGKRLPCRKKTESRPGLPGRLSSFGGCKPDSVPAIGRRRSFLSPFSRENDALPEKSATQPEQISVRGLKRTGGPLLCSVLHLTGFSLPQRLLDRAVSSYLAISPLPIPRGTGGIFSAPLSVTLPLTRKVPVLSHGVMPGGVRTFLHPGTRAAITLHQ